MNEEEKKAVEYLEKYTKWETYGERNLEKDIITTLNLIEKLQKENKGLKILKSGIQTLQNLGIEDGKYIVMSKTDFLNGSCKHLLDDYIPVQKVKDKIKELEEELEIMKVDNIYGRYKEYGGKTKWERLFATKYGMHDALQELLEGRKNE